MSQQQPSFFQVGKIVRTIANYAAYALGLSIIVGIAALLSAFAGPHVAAGCLAVIATISLVAFFRTLVLTRDLMNSVQALGDARNIVQFKMFTRFLFNSIVVGLIGFFWAVVCILVMLTPFFFHTSEVVYDFNTATFSTTVLASMAGEITLCIVGVVMGLFYVPHSYKAWKLVDDYFLILHDPWAREIGLLGTKKILDGHKVAFGTTFIVFGAIGYHIPAFALFIPTIAVCALIAGVKHIQGLYRVGTAFSRVSPPQLVPLYQVQAQAAPSGAYGQAGQPSTTPQPAYFRYQPSQSIYNQGAPVQRPAPPDPLASATGIERQIIQRNQAFLEILDSDSTSQQRQRQQITQAPSPPAAQVPARLTMAPPPPRIAPTAPGTAPGLPGRCKYCLAELPSNTGRCPGCGAALLPI
ncbi:MAG: hypothetical protein JW839_22235 [Candidatus Lokiarchaeota archaeon]|nr:hypothetical protein [Candidatus Lokiarchaeota archaeon]